MTKESSSCVEVYRWKSSPILFLFFLWTGSGAMVRIRHSIFSQRFFCVRALIRIGCWFRCMDDSNNLICTLLPQIDISRRGWSGEVSSPYRSCHCKYGTGLARTTSLYWAASFLPALSETRKVGYPTVFELGHYLSLVVFYGNFVWYILHWHYHSLCACV